MKVLLFEDRVDAAATIKAALAERGHEVEVFVGANHIGEDYLVALRPDLGQEALYPARFDVAFVDGALLGRFHDGFSIVEQLVKHGVVCCGISNGVHSNEDMVAVGAVTALLKNKVVDCLDELLALMGSETRAN